MLSPFALRTLLQAAGRDVVLHLSCKGLERSSLESRAWFLGSEGMNNVLAVSGDCAEPGLNGRSKPVFDVDSVGLLTLLSRINAERLPAESKRPGSPGPIQPAHFFPGAVVNNFKLFENEVIPQLLKLERKLAAGARFIINQVGYDARKIHELIVWMRQRGLGHIPLIGNTYLLSPTAARMFHARRVPGVALSDRLAALCERHAGGPDQGKGFFLEFAAKQMAVFRGLGYRGAYLSGVTTAAEIEHVLRIEHSFGSNDWRHFAREFSFSRPGEFFVFAEDRASGIADPSHWSPDYEASLRSQHAPPREILNYHIAKTVHRAAFTPGKGLWNFGARLCGWGQHPKRDRLLVHAVERMGKRILFDCRNCGDCSLPDTAFLCPEAHCAKNQRNGPCGGSNDGRCEQGDARECIWARAYDRLRGEGRQEQLLAHAPVIQDQSLRGTSSWANTWLGRDHRTKNFTPVHANPPLAPQVPPETDRQRKIQKQWGPIDQPPCAAHGRRGLVSHWRPKEPVEGSV